MHALGSWCERYWSGTGARQSDCFRPLDKNPLRAPTIFRTLRSPLAPCSALLTCSGIGISVTYYDMGQPLSVLQSHMVTLCYKFTCGILINFTIDLNPCHSQL